MTYEQGAVGRKMLWTVVIFAVMLFLSACGDGQPESITVERDTTRRSLVAMQRADPMPVFKRSLERYIAVEAQKARNGAENTWSVFVGNNGTAFDSCASIGYPIPYGVQLTNPEQIADTMANGGGFAILPQVEPNGLYTSGETAATWVACLNPQGDIELRYSEANVQTFAHEVRVVDGQIQHVSTDSSFTIDLDAYKNSIRGGNEVKPVPGAPTETLP